MRSASAAGILALLAALLNLGGLAYLSQAAAPSAPDITPTTTPLPAAWLFLPLIARGAAPPPTPSVTPTATPASLTLTGLVYQAAVGPSAPIPAARVSVTVCVPRTFSALTDAAGHYSLFVPAEYLAACSEVGLAVIANGYQPSVERASVAALLAQPQRDFALHAGPPTFTPTPTATDTAAATPTPTATATDTATATPTPTATATDTATATPTPTAAATDTAVATPTPTPTATDTAVATPSPTPTAEPPDLTLTGRVYDAAQGTSAGIPNAYVGVSVCVPRTFSAVTDAHGDYSLFVPAAYLAGCGQVILSATASGYAPLYQEADTAALFADPRRDFGLLVGSPTPPAP